MSSNVYVRRELPFELFEVNLTGLGGEQLLQISKELGIGLNLDEMMEIQRYFSDMKRNPTDVEIQTIGQTWSEHCYHKTFKGVILTSEGAEENILKKYVARVTRELNKPWCLSVFEDNAGIIDFDEGYAVAAKVETHNHPSAIEPFGGAATGSGGVIRDPLGVWADPIANTDVLCFGPLEYSYEKLPPGVKHPKYLFRGVVAGIGYYGNNMGIPTVNGAVYFDESYVGNVVVYCGCIGILPIDKYVKNVKPGDFAVLAGGRTGRDGIHGVTFASAELTEKSEEVSRPAVQIPNPVEEEKLKRAILEIRDQELGSAITDLGGGGLSCAAGEMAHRFKCGVHIQLQKVPLKYPGMPPWEIWVSESQERMLLSVPPKNLQGVLDIFESEEVTSTPVGKFLNGHTLRVDFQGFTVADIDLEFLFNPPTVKREAVWVEPNFPEPHIAEPQDLKQDLLKLLAAPNICSKETVIRTYDHGVKGNTVLNPLQGKYGAPNDATVLKPLPNSWRGVVISCGMNPNYGKADPYWMAASSIDEAIRNNVAVGGRRIALLDNFTWGNPEKSDRLGGLLRAVKACYDFAKCFGTPFISGKDSLYNESPLGPVTPTLLITAVGIIPDVRKAVSMDVKKPGSPIYLVGETSLELGGSEYYKLKGFTGNGVPKVNSTSARRNMEAVTAAIDAGCVNACHDLSEGGLGVAAAEMIFSGRCGVEISLEGVRTGDGMDRNDYIMFSESNSRFLVEVSVWRTKDFESLMESMEVVYSKVGESTGDDVFQVHGLNGKTVLTASVHELRKAWKSTLGGYGT